MKAPQPGSQKDADQPKVSIIVPTYNYADHLGEAVQSALAQTYPNFEVVIVDDGSQDHTEQVVAAFNDQRIKYVYQENKGLPAARNTAIRASEGEILALLDSDDKFHPDKLRVQVEHLQSRPDLGLSYSARYLVNSNGETLFLQRVPMKAGMAELVSGYPFTPSDIVMRREWAEQVGLYDESFVLNSEDLNFHLRLALAGCKFGGVDRALSYRQIHTDRVFKNIPGKLETYLRALNTVFDHPDCPPEVQALRSLAYANHYLSWAHQAAVQDEVSIAREYFLEAVKLNPELLEEDGRPLVMQMVHASIRDGGDHFSRLRMVFQHLPAELAWLLKHQDAAIARAYLQAGTRDILWGRAESGRMNFERAISLGARLDETLLRTLTDQLTGLQIEFGPQHAGRALDALTPYLKRVGTDAQVRWLRSFFSINQAFSDYRRGEYGRVPASILRAILSDPSHLADRGVISILARSLVGIVVD